MNRFVGGEVMAAFRGLIRGVLRCHFGFCDFSCVLWHFRCVV